MDDLEKQQTALTMTRVSVSGRLAGARPKAAFARSEPSTRAKSPPIFSQSDIRALPVSNLSAAPVTVQIRHFSNGAVKKKPS